MKARQTLLSFINKAQKKKWWMFYTNRRANIKDSGVAGCMAHV